MPYVFDRASVQEPELPDDAEDRSAARLFAVAVSALLISFLVIDSSIAALDPARVAAPSAPGGQGAAPAGVQLLDDDGGSPLFTVPALGPGASVANCLAVSYDGEEPAAVRLLARVAGELADHVDVVVEVGDGATFGRCDGFVRAAVVFEGTLSALAATGPDGVLAYDAEPGGTIRSFRVTTTLRAEAEPPTGTVTAVADLLWRATTR